MLKRGSGPGVDNEASDVFRTGSLEEKPIWSGLYESVRDAMFPPRLPPLELTSTPIPVVDRMAAKTNPWAVGTSTLVNGGILAAVILFGLKMTTGRFADPAPHGHIDLSDWKLPVLAKANASGGSGGSHDLIDPMVGRPPKIELNPMTQPQESTVDHPKLAIDSAIAAPPDVTIPDNSNLPNVGVAKSSNITVISDGQGIHGGIGTNNGGGDGPGSGPGWGPGSEPGVYVPGRGGVTAPTPIFAPEAEFSDEARRQKYQGICLVAVIVDAHGLPQNVHVVQRLGMGLDEKAMEAIRRYRFKPATKDGKPVAAAIVVEVDFRLF